MPDPATDILEYLNEAFAENQFVFEQCGSINYIKKEEIYNLTSFDFLSRFSYTSSCLEVLVGEPLDASHGINPCPGSFLVVNPNTPPFALSLTTWY